MRLPSKLVPLDASRSRRRQSTGTCRHVLHQPIIAY
jgi:hypothetical protein